MGKEKLWRESMPGLFRESGHMTRRRRCGRQRKSERTKNRERRRTCWRLVQQCGRPGGELKAGMRHRRLERWEGEEMEACVSLGCRGLTLWGL